MVDPAHLEVVDAGTAQLRLLSHDDMFPQFKFPKQIGAELITASPTAPVVSLNGKPLPPNA